jgi:beta-RFAP synthase
MSEQPAVCVEAYARLHFGVLDLRGSSGRWFGGIGASASAPSLLVSVSPADTLTVEGDDTDRATAFARRFLDHHHLERGARIRVHRALPSHAGLGSGTQLALSIARALAELHSVDADPRALARAMGRAQRSAIGTWTFAGGGLVVEGGRRAKSDECGPLIARLPFPPYGGASWWYRMVLPASAERTKQRRSHDWRSHPSMTSSTSRTWC